MFPLDGRGKGFTTADGHTILSLEINQGFVYIDGTIWQVNPEEEHIKVSGTFMTKDNLLSSLRKDYGGEWKRVAIPERFLTSKGAERSKLLI